MSYLLENIWYFNLLLLNKLIYMNHSIKFIIAIANVIIPSVPVILHQKICPDSKHKKKL